MMISFREIVVVAIMYLGISIPFYRPDAPSILLMDSTAIWCCGISMGMTRMTTKTIKKQKGHLFFSFSLFHFGFRL
jgi:hypothetical protein